MYKFFVYTTSIYARYSNYYLINAVHFVMLGIQRTFGAISSTTKVEPVKLVNQNGRVNGSVHEYASSSYSNSVSKTWLHTRLMKSIQRLYNLVSLQLKHCRGGIHISM